VAKKTNAYRNRFSRTHVSALRSLSYREWSGYLCRQFLRNRITNTRQRDSESSGADRHLAALQIRLTGKTRRALSTRIITRDMRKVNVGQVVYTPWCDEHGKVIDDGTVSRLEENVYRWTAADPSLRWFTQNAAGMDVRIEDISRKAFPGARAAGTNVRPAAKKSRARCRHREPEILSRD
jgi:aminomethyltransferase